MPRTTNITQEQVNLICVSIQEAGNRPTVERVRAELGTGSRTTINRMIREWESLKPEITKTVEITPVVESAIQSLLQSVASSYESKITEMASALEENKKTVQHYLRESEKHLSEKDQAVKELETLSFEVSDLKGKNEGLVSSNKEYKQNIDQLKKESLSLRDELSKQNDKMMDLLSRAVAAEKELEIIKRMETKN